MKKRVRSNYAHFMHEHRSANIQLMPEHALIRKAGMIAVLILIISSISPSGSLFDSGYAADNGNDIYLTPEDIAYNMQHFISTEEGFLVKSMPTDANAVKIERLDTVEHEVQPGESIAKIAEDYNLVTDTIIWENNIINVDSVKPGQILKIPPTDGISHTVKKGDSLSVIASKYDANIDLISKYNSLDNAKLKIGQNLFVPGGKRVASRLVADTSGGVVGGVTNKKIASVDTDINSNIFPSHPEPKNYNDKIPSPDVAPINGVNGTTNFVQEGQIKVKQDAKAGVKPSGSAPAPTGAGVWGAPTIGQVSQGYHKGHYALDIANRSKPAVWATASGTVEIAAYGWNGGYGNYIIIDHGNGFKTLYAHNEELYVKPGDKVTQGQVISKMGNTGRVYGTTGIHVHYECHQDGTRINPYKCMPPN